MRPVLSRRSAGALAVLTVLALAAAGAGTGPPLAGAAVAAVAPATADHVVVVGVPGLRWADLSPEGTPVLWRLADAGTVGSLSTRVATSTTCPADGWVTIGAGNRARALPHPGGGYAGSCRTAAVPPVRATPDGGAVVAAQRRIVAANDRLRFDARVGVLGDRVGCATAVGPGAALAAADHDGRVDVYSPTLPADLARLLARCPLTVVALDDPVLPEPAGTAREAALSTLDGELARVTKALPTRSLLLVVAPGETGAGTPRLHVAVATTTGRTGDRLGTRGWLRSASTRRSPYVQLVDVAPTALHALGLDQPDEVTGQRMTRADGRSDDVGEAVSRLVDQDVAAGAHRRLVPPFFLSLTLSQLLLYAGSALLLRRMRRRGMTGRDRVRRVTSTAALAFAAAPVSTYLANLAPWWRADLLLPTLLGFVALADAALVAVALAGPWRHRLLGPAGAVAGAGALVLALDLVTGAHLQINSLAGYSPLVAGRFAGVGNVAYAVFATCALLLTAALVDGRPRRTVLLVTALVGTAAVVVDGSPTFGSDFGGVLALVPAFAVLGMLAAGIRPSVPRLAAALLSGVAVVAAFATLDYLRPADSRTHLGRFVAQLLDGSAGTVVARKASANLSLLTHSVLTLLVPFAVLFVALVLLRPTGGLERAFDRSPALRAGLLAVLVMSVLGFVANDSGVAVPALAMTVAIPLALAVSVRALDPEASSDAARHGTSPPDQVLAWTSVELPGRPGDDDRGSPS